MWPQATSTFHQAVVPAGGSRTGGLGLHLPLPVIFYRGGSPATSASSLLTLGRPASGPALLAPNPGPRLLLGWNECSCC